MENEILMAAALGLARFGFIALLGYAFYRILKATPERLPALARSYADINARPPREQR